MDQNAAHRIPHAEHLLDPLSSDLQVHAFLFVFFFLISCDCIRRMFVGQSRLLVADQDTGAVSLPLGGLTRRGQRLGEK